VHHTGFVPPAMGTASERTGVGVVEAHGISVPCRKHVPLAPVSPSPIRSGL